MRWEACYHASAGPEAHLVKGFLEGRGVPCLVHEGGSSMYPAAAFGSKVLVPEHWLAVAQKMIESRVRRRPQRAARGRVLPLRPRRARA
jgi:hypothetical protein